MADQETKHGGESFFQQLFERPFVLLFLGIAVMFGFYTIWGVVELMMMPKATLP